MILVAGVQHTRYKAGIHQLPAQPSGVQSVVQRLIRVVKYLAIVCAVGLMFSKLHNPVSTCHDRQARRGKAWRGALFSRSPPRAPAHLCEVADTSPGPLRGGASERGRVLNELIADRADLITRCASACCLSLSGVQAQHLARDFATTRS